MEKAAPCEKELSEDFSRCDAQKTPKIGVIYA